MQKTHNDIIIFLIVVSAIIVALGAYIISIVFLYAKRQNQFQKNVQQLKLDQEKAILSAQVEIQEETFKHISKEIHDNINQALTVAKLHLNTLTLMENDLNAIKVQNATEQIGRAIDELRDISKSLNSDLIIQQGILRAIEEEVEKIRQLNLFKIDFDIEGTPVYMESKKELVIFRIIQEAFNNILKHANASAVHLSLNYHQDALEVNIFDNGRGFEQNELPRNSEAGLINMQTRAKVLNGLFKIKSGINQGTLINFVIPII